LKKILKKKKIEERGEGGLCPPPTPQRNVREGQKASKTPRAPVSSCSTGENK